MKIPMNDVEILDVDYGTSKKNNQLTFVKVYDPRTKDNEKFLYFGNDDPKKFLNKQVNISFKYENQFLSLQEIELV